MAPIPFDRSSIDTVIFDFDGTLARLNIDFEQMRREVASVIDRWGVDSRSLHNRFVLEMIGETETLLGNHSANKAASFTREAFRMIEAIEVEAALNGALFDGVKELFTELRKVPLQTGIITRNCEKAVRTVFPDIRDYCPVVVCRNDVQRVKPHPEQINLALSRLGGTSGRCIMIGDHPIDIETGKNAGTRTAGVLTGHFRKEDFLQAGADLVLSEAPEILKRLRPELS
ncbi:MAG: HAD family hydrolase [Smithella sp.]|nr:HAD family hydrolase [Smithella sp.]